MYACRTLRRESSQLTALLSAALVLAASHTALPAKINASPQAAATKKASAESSLSSRDIELESIVNQAMGLPPEFGAYFLLRLAEFPQAGDKPKRIDLIERAFTLAESAQFPVKRRSIPGSMVDTRSGYLGRAFQLNLDKLSLQARTVNDLQQLDRDKALARFEQIRFPPLPATSCSEPLVYDPSVYYLTLAELYNLKNVTDDQRRALNALLISTVSQLDSHTQVQPIADMLIAAKLSPGELGDLVDLFSGALQKLEGDEGSFTVVATQYAALGSLFKLVGKLNEDGLPSTALIQATRNYVISNLRGIRCGGNKLNKSALPRAVEDFNVLFQKALASTQISPISFDDVAEYKLGSAPEIHPYWQTSPAREFLTESRRLRFGTGEKQLSLEDRSTADWNAELGEFVAQLESWAPANRDEEEDYFNQKAVLYPGLVELAPTAQSKEKLMRSYVAFLGMNSVEGSNRILWFWHVIDMIERLGLEKQSTGKPDAFRVFAESSDSTLNLYSRIENWLPPSATVTSTQ